MRGLANRSEGLANRSEGLGRPAWPIEVRGWGAGLAWALSIKVRGWGPGWPGPANRSEGLGQAQAGQGPPDLGHLPFGPGQRPLKYINHILDASPVNRYSGLDRIPYVANNVCYDVVTY